MNENNKYLDYEGLSTLVSIIKSTYAEIDDLTAVSTVATNAAQAVTALDSSKQDVLIAGNNITINADGKTINAVVPIVDSALDGSSSNAIENQAVVTGLAGKLDTSLKGANSGLAELDATGKVPTSQLPSYVDDVVEVTDYASLPETGETGKIYITLDDNKTYRWSGSAYVEISASLALGTTSSTAFRGDYGQTAYTHATDASKISAAVASGMYKVAGTADGHIASLTAMSGSDIEGLLEFASNSDIDGLFSSNA